MKILKVYEKTNGYHVAYKPIIILYILFMFIKVKFIHFHSYVMFTMKSMSICNYSFMMISLYSDHQSLYICSKYSRRISNYL